MEGADETLGDSEGDALGESVGDVEGDVLGDAEGFRLGIALGSELGSRQGISPFSASNSRSWLFTQPNASNWSHVTEGIPLPCVDANQFVLHSATRDVSVSLRSIRESSEVVNAVIFRMAWLKGMLSK